MNSSLNLPIVSSFQFLMLWFIYENNPQEITLRLMGLTLIVFIISTMLFGREVLNPNRRKC